MIIEILGKPLSQQRHRHSVTKFGKVFVYDPLAREKMVLKKELEKKYEGTLYDSARISFYFYMPIFKNMPLKEKALAEKEELFHLKKPDVDNLVKFYLDCLVPTVLSDDRGIILGECQKIYSPEPRTVIFLETLQSAFLCKRHFDSSHEILKLSTQPNVSMDLPTYSERPFYSKPRQSRDTFFRPAEALPSFE